MYIVVTLTSAVYLLCSFFIKTSHAFSLDVINTATFSIISMILYLVVIKWNTREIYESLRIESIQKKTISALATVVEERDESTGGHILRTEDYVTKLTDRMKQQERYAALTDNFYTNVILAAPLHDVGKIKIPDAILNKPGRLTPDEFEIMKKHAAYGARIIGQTMQGIEEQEYYDIAFNIAKYHHERYDGSGYPDGLKGEEIPLEARILTLADVYDALVSERVYKKAYSKERARAIIEEGSGTQFDPHLAPLFLECVE